MAPIFTGRAGEFKKAGQFFWGEMAAIFLQFMKGCRGGAKKEGSAYFSGGVRVIGNEPNARL